jgi:hypothetical protein
MNKLTNKITIKPGDSLANIAHEFMSDYSEWRSFAYINKLNIFDELPIGKSLTLPSKEEAENLINSGVDIIQEVNTEVQTTVREILNTREAKTISKLIGVDQTRLLKDLDLSPLAESLNKVISGSSTQEWNLISWVI